MSFSKVDRSKEQADTSTTIFRKLYPERNLRVNPIDPYHLKPMAPPEAMSRRMAGNVIKLEGYFGADRQSIMVRRNQDLIVRDIMEEIEKCFGIPLNEQVIFHKGNNLNAHMDMTIEQLGIENNHPIRINRDTDLPFRSPRQNHQPQMNMMNGMPHQNQQQQQQMNMNGFPQQQQQQQMNMNGAPQQQQHMMMMNNQAPPVIQHNLDPRSYLKENAPNHVPDASQFQAYNQQTQNPQNSIAKQSEPQDILKLNVSFGSEREYVLVHGARPIKISDLKICIARTFKIPVEQQAIVFKGYNMHEYMEDAPLHSFGLENNSHVSVWPRLINNNNNNYPDVRLPRGADQMATMVIAEAYNNTPRLNPGPGQQPRWPISNGRIIKLDAAHGSDHHQVMLYEIDSPLTVLDLQKELEKLTYVAIKDQRIFHRSHEISVAPLMTLAECDMENNSMIKLIGESDSKVKYQNFFTTRPNGAQVGSQGAIGGGGNEQTTPRNPNQPFIDTQYKTF